MKEYNYYTTTDVKYPKKPRQPILSIYQPTPSLEEVDVYRTELMQYQADLKKYDSEFIEYQSSLIAKKNEFYVDLENEERHVILGDAVWSLIIEHAKRDADDYFAIHGNVTELADFAYSIINAHMMES